MQPIIFAFSFNKETQQFTFASNIRPTKVAPVVALEILQKAVLASALSNKARIPKRGNGEGNKAP